MHDASSDSGGVRARGPRSGDALHRQRAASSIAESDAAGSDASSKGAVTPRTLGITGMIIFTFVSTSAGPFGIEGMVSASGPICTVAFVFLVPLVLVVPIILMLTELAAWMPSNHGSVRWVHRAFGPFAGFVNGIFQCTMNMLDLAVYPVMSCNYICRAFWPDASQSLTSCSAGASTGTRNKSSISSKSQPSTACFAKSPVHLHATYASKKKQT